MLQYPVPWDVVFSLTPNLRSGVPHSVDDFSAKIAARIQPEPVIEGLENLPEFPKFVMVANHYQRKGLWIMHAASVITQIVRKRYGPGDPPVRWIVTANWPPLRIGRWRIASPGDWLLPRVANALSCYPVSFAKSNPGFTARSIRRLLREAPRLTCPIGIFPEGVSGTADHLAEPLPGAGRLIGQLAKHGLPVQPFGITERGDRFVIRIGRTMPASDVIAMKDPAAAALDEIAKLISA